MSATHLYLFTVFFGFFVICFASTILSCIYLYFRVRSVNEVLKHPYLEQRAYNQYPMALKLTILLDYFLRLAFPRGKFWVIGQANRLLPHIDPRNTPLSAKLPVLGLWGGCFLGLISMTGVWIIMALA